MMKQELEIGDLVKCSNGTPGIGIVIKKNKSSHELYPSFIQLKYNVRVKFLESGNNFAFSIQENYNPLEKL